MNLKSLTKGAAIALIPVAGFFAWNTIANAEGILPVTLPAPPSTQPRPAQPRPPSSPAAASGASRASSST